MNDSFLDDDQMLLALEAVWPTGPRAPFTAEEVRSVKSRVSVKDLGPVDHMLLGRGRKPGPPPVAATSTAASAVDTRMREIETVPLALMHEWVDDWTQKRLMYPKEKFDARSR